MIANIEWHFLLNKYQLKEVLFNFMPNIYAIDKFTALFAKKKFHLKLRDNNVVLLL